MIENNLDNENALVLRVSQGDELAFRTLFDHYRDRIYSLGMYLTKSESLAEELVQDVFLKVWKNREKLSTIQYFNAWLRTVAKNTCSNYLRTLAIEKLAMVHLGGRGSDSTESVENDMIVKEFEQIIHHAIQQLPTQQKKVYILSKQFSKKQDEIAKELNISIHTVKEYMKLANRSIRSHLDHKAEFIVLTAISIYL